MNTAAAYYTAVFLVVFFINILPAFGPPWPPGSSSDTPLNRPGAGEISS